LSQSSVTIDSGPTLDNVQLDAKDENDTPTSAKHKTDELNCTRV